MPGPGSYHIPRLDYEEPLTPALSPPACLGKLAFWSFRIRKRMRMGEGVRLCPLRGRPLSQPYPLADAATLRRKLAKASLLGEGQGEGVFAATAKVAGRYTVMA